METNRKTTVMFASFIGTSSVVEAAGESAAQNAIERCFERIGGAATSCGGRLIKTMHDKAMILVATPDGAADAAVAIHTAVGEFPAIAAVKLGLGIGFHYGPVIQDNADVFGDTVNLAARLEAEAPVGKVVVGADTAAALPPGAVLKRLPSLQVKGKEDPIEAYVLHSL